jgi:hypothetical protein
MGELSAKGQQAALESVEKAFGGLFPAGEQEVEEHTEEGEQEDYENPQQFFDRIRVALEAIEDRNDIQHQNDQT